MSESELMEVVDHSTTPSIANQFDIVDVEAAEAFMNNYQELVKALLDKSDYQKIGKNNFKKKSAWRKLATAFNISDEIIKEEITRDESGQIISATYYVKATLPNGRSGIGIGACSIFDKIRYNDTGKYPADSEDVSHFELRGRFSNAEHDIPSTAHSRAKNRAISDLIGAGDVSAEEMSSIGEPKAPPRSAPKPKAKAPAPKPKEETIEAKAEVVEAEVVTEETKPKKKSMTIKELMDNNQHIKKAVHALQDQEINVSRATISEKLMDLWDMGKISKADYDVAINELKQ
ncbi:hypothetical protein [uncultured Methanobrevibacter sp.]|uniref:hypothetical protein n=1 Tax=uncultured Methanobrevibacter sp. TaxID=253161 RepID=UPI0025D7F7DE|nr:hypothetical protein [uncultured Methanobrevibacter sp.]